jgi:hypothetical protein
MAAVNISLAQCLSHLFVTKMDDRFVAQRINIKFIITLEKCVLMPAECYSDL